MDNLISVIVPIYNVEKYLPKCIESIINQTYKNLEIILVDDGSPDGCGKICDEYAKIDKRIKVIHKPNGGVSSARNAGLDVARGGGIAFVDGDDFIEPNMYEELIKKQNETQADLTFCFYSFAMKNGLINVNEKIMETFCETRNLTYLFNHENYHNDGKELFYNSYITGSVWHTLFKKETIENIRFSEDVRYMEDTIFLSRAILNAKSISYVNKYLYNYVLRENSAIHFSNEAIVQNCISYINNMSEVLKNTKYENLISALKFHCYSYCLFTKLRFNAKLSLKEIREWKSFKNFKANNKISIDKTQKIKNLLVYLRWDLLTKMLLKIKDKNKKGQWVN